MASNLPNLTPQQRSAALQKAADSRTKRAEFIARLRTGETSGSAGLDEALGDDVLAKTWLTVFLRALPGWGQVSVEKFLVTSGIADNRRLRELRRNQLDAVRRAVSG